MLLHSIRPLRTHAFYLAFPARYPLLQQPVRGMGSQHAPSAALAAPAAAAVAAEPEPPSLMHNANFWRVVVFTTCVLFTSQQWRYQDLVLPK